LVRDPFGEKPLYLAQIAGAFVFASELKAIQAHPAFARSIHRQSLVAFVRHGYLGTTGSLYDDVAQIAPGSCVTITRAGERSVTQWWDHEAIATEARRERFDGSDGEAVEMLDRLIHASISRQSVADVRVGAFLSGGIDSSVIAAIMQAQRATRIDTFTLGFQEEAFNEAPYARDVARHIGSQHHEIILSGEDARDLVAQMPDIYDEPFADPSQLPTTLLTGFARKGVTVCLSGDAGDELFAGYGRYHAINKRWSNGMRGYALRVASAAYAQLLLGLIAPAQALGVERMFGRGLWPLSLRLGGLKTRSEAANPLEAYERSFTVVDQAHLFVRDGESFDDPLIARIAAHEDWSTLEQATMLDCYRYLPDDILVKVDRAAMSHSLETRVPLLDPDIAAFAWSLSDAHRLMNGERKGILKAVLNRYVPRELWDRPKRGFGIPAASWLRGPFRSMAEDLFSPARLRRQGLLEEAAVTQIWRDFLAGGQRRTNLVWTLFILQLYLAREEA
jgi:asparagine synthase (glutamine-hydrolysing)